jgi:ABC-2 type transport system permease protein
MRILELTLKDLNQLARDRRILLFLVAMPVVFTVFMGFALRSAAQPADPRLALGWVTHDPQGLLSQQLRASLAQNEALRVVDLDAARQNVNDSVSKGDVAGVLSVPANFSADALAGRPAQLSLITNPLSTRGQSLAQLVRGEVTQLMSSAAVARLDVATIAAQKPFGSNADRQTELQAAFQAAAQAWSQVTTGSQLKIESSAARGSGAQFGGNPYNQTSPGIMVQFAIFGLVSSAQILVQERKTRTLQRLLTTNMKPWEIVAGHLLANFGVVFLQTALLIAFGQWFLGVNYLREPLGTLVVAIALGLWVSSMGLLIGAVAKGEEQVVLFSLIAMFALSALGGAWFPLEGAGQAFATVGHLTPAAWAIDGFQNILIRGLGLPSVWLPAAILLAYALGFFGLAVWRLKFE